MVSTQHLELWQNPEVFRPRAEEHYRNLPFHNWNQHILRVEKNALRLGQLCIDNDAPVNMLVIQVSAVYHDSDYWMTPGVDHDFPSKEQYSSHVAGVDLKELGAPKKFIKHVQSSINSTEKNVECESLEAKCLFKADLANVAGHKPLNFLRNTVRLYLESKQLAGVPLSAVGSDEFIRFCSSSHDLLSLYFAKDVSLGPFDLEANGKSAFFNRGYGNIELLKNIDLLHSLWKRPKQKG